MTRKRIIFGVILGAAAGAIDVITMLIQGLSWDANLSAFSL
jgi:predicted small secreted protein